MKRLLNLSHLDLDGCAASVAVKLAHPKDHVVTKFVHYGNVDKLLLKALQETKQPYDRIVLSDISWRPVSDLNERSTPEERELTERRIPEAVKAFTARGGRLVVLDHHPRALDILREYGPYLHPDSILETEDAEGVARAGSEQAARYYTKLRGNQDLRLKVHAVQDLCKLAGDYDVWRDPLGFGGDLAMASMAMNDVDGQFREFLDAVELAVMNTWKEPIDWTECFEGAFGHYLKEAPGTFEQHYKNALNTAIHHHPLVTEVYCEFFPSLISMRLYEETGGVVLIRYEEGRTGHQKFSLRRSRDSACTVDLGEVSKQFGGGGHVVAAGGKLGNGQTLDDVAQALIQALGA